MRMCCIVGFYCGHALSTPSHVHVAYLPLQGGTVKLYKGLVCPLDNYELLLFSLTGGADGKTYPFCECCMCCLQEVPVPVCC